MIQFSNLRLSGFKSFVDKTELEIGPGLNGIVGPNGCGKSNLLEALRWVMGENSAKRMRGAGMEDVIFSGTGERSARNFAEVSLLLDNTTRQAPKIYNDNDQIEVIRKIERDKGSNYKINGKNVRARDVQMLFADTVTGANSPSLVSQGHVTRMINAKPQDRRLILEESAGIAGLYARRHEAETRLKAADTNLVRVEDILGSMENRLNALKRQARQAHKYKNLSAQIRQMELAITYLEWHTLVEKQKDIKDDFAQAESLVAEKLITVTQLTKTHNTQSEDLPTLRQKEATLGAKLQKHKLDLQRLEDEAKRYLDDVQETKTQRHQTQIDKQHEEQTLEESTSLLERIEEEHKKLLEDQDNDQKSHHEKQSEKEKLKADVITLEEKFTALKESAAEARTREFALENQIQRNQNHMHVLLSRKGKILQEKENLVIDEENQKRIKELEQKTSALENHLQTLKNKMDQTRQDMIDAEEKTNSSRDELSTVQKKHAAFITEISMLKEFFQNEDEERFKPILDSIVTQPGFEKALSRALGDSLMASMDENAPIHWKNTHNNITIPDLPDGATSLLPHIEAPKNMNMALSCIGFVKDQETGERLAPLLKVGQSLVSADGVYWRWDGYHTQAHAQDRHSVYLEQKNKLIALETQRKDMLDALDSTQKALDENLSRQNRARDAYDRLLSDIKETENALRELRPALQKIREKNLRIESEKKHCETQIQSIEEDIRTAQETLDHDQIALDTLIEQKTKDEANDDMIANIKTKLDETKEHYQNAVRAFDMFEQTQNTRRARIQAIADERISLNNRAIRATNHLQTLNERLITLSEKLTDLEDNPANTETAHQNMLTLISETEKEQTTAAEYLKTREDDVAATNKALKEAESILGDARENRARAQATLSAINEQLNTMETTIKEQFNMPPHELVNHAALDLVQYQTGDLPKLNQNKEALIRDRNATGPVNLRAEEEANELEKELTTLLHEQNDLTQAIEELRSAINKINKEARERLNTAFDHVNAHFQKLFVRLFGGGKAYLELMTSDDPMATGLEIYAQPPGKTLQSLSLLSGGEQTLTSIALIFAMFLTNPSPICVLDEIDAPLDDANVDRVCDLLEDIAERGETRFLIITHHRLSMARMNRLYGVTMSEKGVSQLVSVDLQQSFDFIDQKVA